MPSPVSRETRARVLAGDEPAWLQRHPRRIYLVNLIRATPDWVDRKALCVIYGAARRIRLGGTYVVTDHIVPLTHHDVCGLNVPWNLRIISGAENAARSNRWWEWTPDLFTEPQQLELQLMGYVRAD